MATLSIDGIRKSGQVMRDENATAVAAVANVIRNSLGPAGLDKVIVDDTGEITISNDGATILNLIEVEHPAAKILVDLAQLQDKEVGDGTTSVVILASELVQRGNQLVRKKIHPTTVISGFQQARKAACKFLAENLAYKLEDLGRDCLLGVAKTALSSKAIGAADEHFAELCVRAMETVGKEGAKGKAGVYNVKDVAILKLKGDSLKDSELLEGVVILRNRSLDSFEMPNQLSNVKIALIDFDLRREKLPFNVKVQCTDPDSLEGMREAEVANIEKRINLILKAGANVILSTRSIDDFAMKSIARKDAMAFKNVSRAELRQIAKVSGARILTSLAELDGKEKVAADALGAMAAVREKRMGDLALMVEFEPKAKAGGIVTLLLRGPNDEALEEAERAVHDVLCALKRVMESKRVVVGGGVCEAALSVYLENFAETIGSRDQVAVSEFSTALLAIPKALATNGAFDSLKLVAELRAAHSAVIRDGESKLKSVGFDLRNGRLRNNLKAGVLEPAMSKVKSLKFATEAAIAILRIDDSILPDPSNNQAGNHPGGAM